MSALGLSPLSRSVIKKILNCQYFFCGSLQQQAVGDLVDNNEANLREITSLKRTNDRLIEDLEKTTNKVMELKNQNGLLEYKKEELRVRTHAAEDKVLELHEKLSEELRGAVKLESENEELQATINSLRLENERLALSRQDCQTHWQSVYKTATDEKDRLIVEANKLLDVKLAAEEGERKLRKENETLVKREAEARKELEIWKNIATNHFNSLGSPLAIATVKRVETWRGFCDTSDEFVKQVESLKTERDDTLRQSVAFRGIIEEVRGAISRESEVAANVELNAA